MIWTVTEFHPQRNITRINFVHQSLGTLFQVSNNDIYLLYTQSNLFGYCWRLQMFFEVESCNFTLLTNLLSYRSLICRQRNIFPIVLSLVLGFELKLDKLVSSSEGRLIRTIKDLLKLLPYHFFPSSINVWQTWQLYYIGSTKFNRRIISSNSRTLLLPLLVVINQIFQVVDEILICWQIL